MKLSSFKYNLLVCYTEHSNGITAIQQIDVSSMLEYPLTGSDGVAYLIDLNNVQLNNYRRWISNVSDRDNGA